MACDATDAPCRSRSLTSLAVICLAFLAGTLEGVAGERDPDDQDGPPAISATPVTPATDDATVTSATEVDPDEPTAADAQDDQDDQVEPTPEDPANPVTPATEDQDDDSSDSSGGPGDPTIPDDMLRKAKDVRPWESEPKKELMTPLQDYQNVARQMGIKYAIKGTADDPNRQNQIAAKKIGEAVQGHGFFKEPEDGKGNKASAAALDKAFSGPPTGVQLEQDETMLQKFNQGLQTDVVYQPLPAERGKDGKHGEYEPDGVLKPASRNSTKDEVGKKFSWFNPTISREIPIRDAIENIRLAARYSRWVTQAHLNALSNQDDVTNDLLAKFQELSKGVSKYAKDVWNELDMEDSLRMEQLRTKRPQGEWDPDAGFTRVRGADSARGTAWDPSPERG